MDSVVRSPVECDSPNIVSKYPERFTQDITIISCGIFVQQKLNDAMCEYTARAHPILNRISVIVLQ